MTYFEKMPAVAEFKRRMADEDLERQIEMHLRTPREQREREGAERMAKMWSARG